MNFTFTPAETFPSGNDLGIRSILFLCVDVLAWARIRSLFLLIFSRGPVGPRRLLVFPSHEGRVGACPALRCGRALASCFSFLSCIRSYWHAWDGFWAHAEIQGPNRVALMAITTATGIYFLYQGVYWNFLEGHVADRTINNVYYDSFGDGWYTAIDDPIALLRAEAEVKNPWVIRQIENSHISRPAKVLDIGCGAGFFAPMR